MCKSAECCPCREFVFVETRRETINARHSPKYFGLKKGIVSYTLVANHIPVNARIIGAVVKEL